MAPIQYDRSRSDPINSFGASVIPTSGVFEVKANVKGTDSATATNYGKFFIAPYKCRVIKITEVHAVAGSDLSAVTLSVEKLNSTDALDAGDNLIPTPFDLKATADTVQSATVTTDTTLTSLGVGDRLALKDTGVLTDVADVNVTVTLKWLKQ